MPDWFVVVANWKPNIAEKGERASVANRLAQWDFV